MVVKCSLTLQPTSSTCAFAASLLIGVWLPPAASGQSAEQWPLVRPNQSGSRMFLAPAVDSFPAELTRDPFAREDGCA